MHDAETEIELMVSRRKGRNGQRDELEGFMCRLSYHTLQEEVNRYEAKRCSKGDGIKSNAQAGKTTRTPLLQLHQVGIATARHMVFPCHLPGPS